MKHNIYALVDPRNESVFYIGSTILPLRIRLSAHVSFNPCTSGTDNHSNKRKALINDIIKCGKYPGINVLHECDTDEVDDIEEKYYYKYKAKGYTLHQSPSFFTSSRRILGASNDANSLKFLYRFINQEQKESIRIIAEKNGCSINKEISAAISNHIKKNKHLLR